MEYRACWHELDAEWDSRLGECYEIRDISVCIIGHDGASDITMRKHILYSCSVIESLWEMLPFYVTIWWHAGLFFLVPGFIGQKGMIIRIKRPVIGIYIQAHYPVAFGKYLTSSKQRKNVIFPLQWPVSSMMLDF